MNKPHCSEIYITPNHVEHPFPEPSGHAGVIHVTSGGSNKAQGLKPSRNALTRVSSRERVPNLVMREVM